MSMEGKTFRRFIRKTSKRLSKLNKKYNGRLLPVTIVVIIGLIGVVTLIATKAATPTASFEAESTTKTGVSTISDTLASNSSAIQFGAGSATDPLEISKKCSQLTNLKFCEDFDGVAGTYPNGANFGVVDNLSEWGVQCFKKNPNNVSHDGQGNLKLTLINTGTTQCTNNWDPAEGQSSNITSGYVDSAKAGASNYFKYGKFEIRAKTSCAPSTWGALWLSTGNGGVSWPRSGEIDIWEQNMQRPGTISQTLWYPKKDASGNITSSADHIVSEYSLPSGQKWCDQFHVYGVDWRPGQITFTADGKATKVFTPSSIASTSSWPFDTYNLRMLLDLQLGKAGEWMGAPDLSQLPTSMLIDYVRVYDNTNMPPPTSGGGGGTGQPQPGGALAVPENFKATAGTGSVSLDWDDVLGANNYTVCWGTGGNCTTYSNTVGSNPTTSSYTVNNLSAGTVYSFSVAARDSTGTYTNGSYSSKITATPR